MPFRLPNAVHETTTTSGTGPLTLLGAVTDRKTFGSQLSNGDTTMIVITDGTDWECAVGTFTSPSTISRDTVIYSTNGNALVNWPASGTRDVLIATAGEVFAGLVDPAVANGVIVKTGDRTYAGRSIDVDTDDLQIANPAGTAGNPTLALAFAVSAFAKTLLDDADVATARATLGLTTDTDNNANTVVLRDGAGGFSAGVIVTNNRRAAAIPGVFSASEADLAVGAIILARCGSSTFNRGSVVSNVKAWSGSNLEYVVGAAESGTLMAGTWVAMGMDVSASPYRVLLQRVA